MIKMKLPIFRFVLMVVASYVCLFILTKQTYGAPTHATKSTQQHTLGPVSKIILQSEMSQYSIASTGITFSISAVPEDSNNDPLPNVPLTFYISSGTSGLNLDQPNVTSNQHGQAVVHLTSNYSGSTLPQTYTLHATAVNTTIDATVGVQLVSNSDHQTFTTPDPVLGPGYDMFPFPGRDYHNIRWRSSSRFLTYITAAIGLWNAEGHVKFASTQAGSKDPVDVTFEDYFDANTNRVMQTTPTFPKKVMCNVYFLDGNPMNLDPQARSNFPPMADNHDITGTLAHEIGHVLGLQHNPVDCNALLWFSEPRYYVYETQTITSDETTTVDSQLCPNPVP